MQLSRRARVPGAKKRGFLTTGAEIVKRETPLGLYKGLGAVVTGIVPKMAIRFTSFEAYKKLLANKETGAVSGQATFLGKYLDFSSCTYFTNKFTSWSASRCHRGRRSRNPHGSHQNPPTSPTPQHGRSPRHTEIPQCSPRTLHSLKRGRTRSSISRSLSHSFTAGLAPPSPFPIKPSKSKLLTERNQVPTKR
jgi:hypothetical protein